MPWPMRPAPATKTRSIAIADEPTPPRPQWSSFRRPRRSSFAGHAGVAEQTQQPVGGLVRVQLVAGDRLVHGAGDARFDTAREPVADPLGEDAIHLGRRPDEPRTFRGQAVGATPVQERDELGDAVAGER